MRFSLRFVLNCSIFCNEISRIFSVKFVNKNQENVDNLVNKQFTSFWKEQASPPKW